MEHTEENIVAAEYDSYLDIQQHHWDVQRRKTRNKLFALAALFLIADLIALSVANLFTPEAFIGILLVPVLLTGAAFLALNNPIAAMAAATLIIVALFAFQVYMVGPAALISGLLVKAVMVYLIAAGWASARDAAEAKRNLAAGE